MEKKFITLVKVMVILDIIGFWIWEVIKLPLELAYNVLVALVLGITTTSLKNAILLLIKVWQIRMKEKIKITKKQLNVKVERSES